MSNDNSSIDRKDVNFWATLWTVVYLVLFPFACAVALFSPMVFCDCRVFMPFGLIMICFVFLIPISIPVSIYLIWSSYERAQYKKTYSACFVPIFTCITVELLNYLIQIIQIIFGV